MKPSRRSSSRALGIDLILVGQHFLTSEFAMLQPAVAATRLAAEAGSMRIGVAIYLLPLLNPVAVAEEAASLDIVSGGRFIFGVGLGYRDVEEQAFGMSAHQRVERFLRHLHVVKQLWSLTRQRLSRRTVGSPGCGALVAGPRYQLEKAWDARNA